MWEQVFDNQSNNRDLWLIWRHLTNKNAVANGQRTIFVGAETYTEAGGVILRDQFIEDRGGFSEDAALLDRLSFRS